MRTIRRLIIHQSASSWGDVKAIDAWHRQRGWKGIGYHRVILNGYRTARSAYDAKLDGVIQTGRPDEQVGAHCAGANADSLGICLIGDGRALGDGGYMTSAQHAALVDACYRLCKRYGITYNNVVGHNEMASGIKQGKTCPGFAVSTLRKELQAYRVRLEGHGR